MGEIIMREWDLGEFCVWVNLPILIQRIPLPIRQGKTPILVLLNPMRQVTLWLRISARILHIVPIIIPYLFFSTIIAEHNVKSSLSISPCHAYELTQSKAYTEYTIHRVQHTPSTAYTEYSIHRVQHTPSTAYNEYSVYRVQHPAKIICHPFIPMITIWPLNVASASGVPPYTIDCHQPALHESLKVRSHCHIPTVAS